MKPLLVELLLTKERDRSLVTPSPLCSILRVGGVEDRKMFTTLYPNWEGQELRIK